MRKKIFTLLTLMLAVCSGAWADSQAVFNYASSNPGAKVSNITVSGDGSYSNKGYLNFSNSSGGSLMLTADDGYVINGVSLTYTDSGSDRVGGTPTVTTQYNYEIDGTTGTVSLKTGQTAQNALTITFTNKARITSMTVTYTSGTLDETAPTLESTSPAANATNVAKSGSIVLTFDENVACTTAATLTPEGGDAINLGAPTVSGTTVTYAYSGLDLNKAHTFNLAANSVADGSDNKYASAISFSFTTTANAAVTIGLAQTITDSGDTHTIGEASYTGTDHVTITSSIGSNCGYSNYSGKTIIVGSPAVTYTANYSFRKTQNGTEFLDDQYVGYTMAVASGYKVSLSNLNAEFWSSDATMTWKVVVLNPSGTAIYESGTARNNSNNKGTITVETPTGLTDLVAGTYTIKLMMHQAGGNKYFAVPNFNFDATVEVDDTPTCTITASVADGQSSMGSIDMAGENVVPEGGSITLTATANEGYNFINWTKDDEEYATTASITLENVTANATYVANFAQATRVVYPKTYAGTYGKMGTNYNLANNVNEKWADKDNKFTIPSYMHKYFYREGFRFNKWQVVNDGTTNRYDSGDEVTINNAAISNSQATINPCFVATTKTVADALVATDVTWSFAKSDMVFVDWQCGDENKYEYYTVTATIAGEVIDVPMKITKGKVANYTRTDNIAQTNNGTKFIIPAVKGMTVVIADANTAFSATTVAGSTDYTKSNNNKTLSYTYNGEDKEIAIVIGENNQYLKTIKVTYPAATTTVTTNAGKWASFTPSWNATLSDGATAYIITGTDDTTVTAESVSVLKAGEGYFVKGADASTAYTATATADAASATTGNMIVGCTTNTAITESSPSSYDKYVLGTVNGESGLFRVNSNVTVTAGKAYLQTTSTSGARQLSLDFDDETMGVETMKTQKNLLDGDFFDLQGRKVAQPTKGLYIVNGKKVVIK